MLPGEVNFARLRSIYLEGEGDSLEPTDGRRVEQQDFGQQDSVTVDETRDGERHLRRVILTHYLYA